MRAGVSSPFKEAQLTSRRTHPPVLQLIRHSGWGVGRGRHFSRSGSTHSKGTYTANAQADSPLRVGFWAGGDSPSGLLIRTRMVGFWQGSGFLSKRLNSLLEGHIRQVLPDISKKAKAMLREASEELTKSAPDLNTC